MNWHYLDNGQQRGPVSEADFSTLVQQGTIRLDTPIWCEGMAEWKTYGELLAPAAVPSEPSAAPAEPAAAPDTGGLRIRRDTTHAPAATREAHCSQCGTVVAASQLMTVGSAQLCPRCQAAHRRLSFGGGEQTMEYASPLLRLGAFLLDAILCSVGVGVILLLGVMATLAIGKDEAGKAPGFIGLVVGFAMMIWILDYFVGRIARSGATPAMGWFKLQVVTSTGGAVGGWRAFGRYVMIGLINQFTLALGHLIAFFDKRRRSLHDLVCGTVVIKK